MKKGMIVAVLAMLGLGCAGPFWLLGPTPTPASVYPSGTPSQAMSPAPLSPQRFWQEELHPLLVEFQAWDEAAQQTSAESLAPLVAGMISSTAKLKALDSTVPPCARLGLSRAIRGEEMLLSVWTEISSGVCVPGPVAGFCYVDEWDQTAKDGSSLLDSAIAQVKADCGIQ